MNSSKLSVKFLIVGILIVMCALAQGANLNRQEQSGTNAKPVAGKQVGVLSSVDPVERAAAACALGKMGAQATPSIPALIQLLDDGTRIDPKLICYRGLHDDQSGQPDMESLKEPSPGEAATEALIAIGAPAVAPLIDALKSNSARVRKNAVWALAQIGDDRALLPLIEATTDGAWQVRAYAAAALGEQRDERIIKPLLAGLKDEKEHVRWFAAASLGNVRNSEVVEPLIDALKDQHPRVRAYAAASLGQMRDERAVEPLIAALRDDSTQVRMYAAASLGSLNDSRAIVPLTSLLKDKSQQVRTYVRSSLDIIRP